MPAIWKMDAALQIWGMTMIPAIIRMGFRIALCRLPQQRNLCSASVGWKIIRKRQKISLLSRIKKDVKKLKFMVDILF